MRRTATVGRVAFMVHSNGGWIRGRRGDGAGWCLLGPKNRPLYGERHEIRQRVLLRFCGWRLKRMDPIT